MMLWWICYAVWFADDITCLAFVWRVCVGGLYSEGVLFIGYHCLVVSFIG